MIVGRETSNRSPRSASQRSRIPSLLLIAILSVLPLFIALGQRDATRVMENIVMASSQETWMRQCGGDHIQAEKNAWLIPSLNGHPRIFKPPLVVWLNLLSWSGLEPRHSSCEELVLRARLVAVMMGLLVLAAVWNMGVRFGGGRRAGVLAALAAATMWFFQREARTASYDIHLTAWATIAVWCGIELIFTPRQLMKEWSKVLLCGFFAGLAWLSKGPVAIGVVFLPLSAIALAMGKQRRRALIGLFLAMAVAALTVAPWFTYIMFRVPHAARLLFYEYYTAQLNQSQSWLYYIGFLGLILPWTLWLVAGLLWSIRAGAIHRQDAKARIMLIPLIWLGVLVIFFSLSGAKQQRYMLPAVPPAALLVGSFSISGWKNVGGNMLQWTLRRLLALNTLLGTLLLTATAVVLIFPGRLERWGVLRHGEFIPMPVAAVLILLMGSYVVWRIWMAVRSDSLWYSGVMMSVLAALISSVLWWSYKRDWRDEEVESSRRIGRIVSGSPFYYYRRSARDTWIMNHCEGFLFYVRRIIPSIGRRDLARLENDGGSIFLMAFDESGAESQLRQFGFVSVTSFLPQSEFPAQLWKLKAAGDSQARMKELP